MMVHIAVHTIVQLLVLKASVTSYIVNNGQQPECWGIECHHGGHLNYTTCTCVCPQEYTGFFCETELKETMWPKGHFSMLSSVFGCPEDHHYGWYTGYINMSLSDDRPEQRWKMPIPEFNPIFPADPHLLGPYTRRTLQLNFCTRRDDIVSEKPEVNNDKWPTGNYCLFQHGHNCPKVFLTTQITFGEYHTSWSDTDGILPRISVKETTGVPTFYFCCRVTEHEDANVTFPSNYPFILIKPTNTSSCPEVSGMTVSEERFDLVDDHSMFESTGNLTVLTDSGDGYKRLEMCYYASSEKRECMYEIDGGFSYRGTQNMSAHGNPCLHWYDVTLDPFGEKFVPYRDYVGDFDHNHCRTYWPWGQRDRNTWCWVMGPDGNQIIEPCDVPLCEMDPEIEPLDINKPVYSVDHRPGKEPEHVVDGIYEVPFVSNRPKNKPWIQIDMEENLEVHAIFIQREYVWFPNNLRRPGIYVSPNRWDFIAYGALQCAEKNFPRRANKFWYQCYRPITGQYVTIRNFDDPDPYTTWGDYYFLEIKAITVYHKRGACSRRLGMISGDIRDFQIDGSGDEANGLFDDGRIFNAGSGWCFEYNITKYLEVDTIVPTVIRGLEIQGTPDGKYENVQEVEVEYGVKADHMIKYLNGNEQPMKFQVDYNGKAGSINRFMFGKPFVARYVRVIVTSPESTPICMKMELIGCPKRVVRDVRCSKPDALDVGFEAITRTAFWMEGDTVHDVINETECLQECDKEGCRAAYYNWLECSLFTATRHNPHYMHWIVNDLDPLKKVFTRLCIQDVREFDDCDRTISEPTVIESPFYPQYFGQLSTCVWNIDFPTGQYPRLKFLHLEFPKGDDLSTLQGNGYFDVKIGTCKDTFTIDGITITEDNDHSHRNSLFISHTPNVTITLKTCARYSKATASWFKIDVSYSDIPGCGFLSRGNDKLCTFDKGLIAVPGFPTSMPADLEHYWTIIGTRGQYVELKVQVLLFPRSGTDCRDTYIKVEDRSLQNEWLNIGSFCNYQQVVEPMTSSWQAMRLTFRSGPENNNGNVVGAGFMAEYKLIQYVQDIGLESNTGCPYGWVYRNNSCYQLFTVPGGVTWIQAEESCNQLSGHLVSLQSQAEVSFLHFLLTERWTNWTNKADFYIGLRKSDYGGNFADYIWSDGTPASFLAWFKGSGSGDSQPNGMNNELCTFLSLYSILSTDNWHDVACAYDNIANYICEIQLDASEGITTYPSISFGLINASYDGFFVCVSGEMTKSIYICDGIADCFDGSDENNCNEATMCDRNGFQCSNGECIDSYMLCDFVEDCSNGADEVGCVYPPCETDEWRCYSGQCIPIDSRCDVKHDCLDGSDERECSICQGQTFQCYDQRCVTADRLCDTFYDCTGRFHEDEVDRNCTFNTRASCWEWYSLGKRSNGTYMINLNQPESFEVECRFGETDGELVVETLIHHDMETTVAWADQPALDVHINYGATDDQIRLVKQMSKCRQYIKIGCQQTTFYLRWVAFDGTFFENRNKTGECDCPYVGKCNTTLKQCTCFSINHPDWFTELYFDVRSDEGIITNQSAIPIKRFVTPSLQSQFKVEAQLTVGPLVCVEERTESTAKNLMVCKNGHIISMSLRCIMDMDSYGDIIGCRDLSHLENCETFECPADYMKCHKSYCIPTHYICDGTRHCPNGEDELTGLCSETNYCIGLYRCRDSRICIPPSYVCDGVTHCPLRDDETPCTESCPIHCNCTGYKVTCSGDTFMANSTFLDYFLKVKSLQIYHQHLQVRPEDLSMFPLLNHLNISSCGLTALHSFQFNYTLNLVLIDARYNKITELQHDTFYGLVKLRSLYLKGNKLVHIHPFAFSSLVSLTSLDLSGFSFKVFEYGAFDGLESLSALNISFNGIKTIKANQFESLSTLKELDLRGNRITDFRKQIFFGLQELEFLYTDSFTLCCVKPPTVLEENCWPPKNEFSSCDDLMRNEILRVAVWLIGIAAFIGNIIVLVVRFYIERDSLGKTYSIFVTNLSIADFLMGVYLIIIAITDSVFRGSYVWNDFTWRNGDWCKLAGVIATVGSEGSVLFLCLITIDRLLVVKFPFGNVRISKLASIILCVGVWIIVLALAVVPLIMHSAFYSRSAVCLALPLTRDRPKGWQYSIGVYIVFNFLAFVLIATAQIVIYLEISSTRMSIASRGRRVDMAIARKLFFVAITDFMCWFPVGLMGILALNDHVISGEVYAWIAVFVLPINSAINPFLYTLGSSLSKKRMTMKSSRSFSQSSIREDKSANVTEVFDSELFLFGNQKQASKLNVGLDQFLSQTRLEPKEAFLIAFKLCRALDLLHNTEMIHGCINSAAVIVTASSSGKMKEVVLKSSPKYSTQEEDFKKDIYDIGDVLKQIVRNLSRK